MKFDVIFVRTADDDVDVIGNYLSTYSTSAANRFSDELERTVNCLRNNPEGYPIYADIPTFRRAIIGKYSIFFVVDKVKKTVTVHRILHQARNITASMLRT